MNTPEVMIGEAPKKFDAEGRLTDTQTREFIAKFLVALKDWIGLFRR
jgi:chromate reductase